MLGLELEPTKIGQSILPSQTGQTDRNRPQSLDNLPLLQSLLAVDSIKPGAQILAHAIDRSKVTRTPLIVSQFAGAGRTCFIGTDETYRWTTAARINTPAFWTVVTVDQPSAEFVDESN